MEAGECRILVTHMPRRAICEARHPTRSSHHFVRTGKDHLPTSSWSLPPSPELECQGLHTHHPVRPLSPLVLPSLFLTQPESLLTLQPTLQLCPVHIPSCKDENGRNFRAILPAAAPEPRNTTCLSAHPALRVKNLGDLCKVGRGSKTHSNHEHLINPEDNVKGER